MKRTLLLVFLFSIASYAGKPNDSADKKYEFKFKYHSDTFEVKRSAASYEDAFQGAAEDCFNHFTGTRGKQKVSENLGVEVIDVCANPRS